jgi:hypothetical protein
VRLGMIDQDRHFSGSSVGTARRREDTLPAGG